MLTQERLKDLFNYNPETGVFKRLVSASLNTKAGQIAGSANGKGYLRIMVDGKQHKSHRLAWLYVYGEFPSDQVDHINGVKDDNRLTNLRAVTNAENSKNVKMRISNTSGTMGVYWDKPRGKWRAQIKANGKNKYLGIFKDISEAIAVRKKAEILHGFHENHGRL